MPCLTLFTVQYKVQTVNNVAWITLWIFSVLDLISVFSHSSKKKFPNQKLLVVPQLPERGSGLDFVVYPTLNYHFLHHPSNWLLFTHSSEIHSYSVALKHIDLLFFLLDDGEKTINAVKIWRFFWTSYLCLQIR